MGGKLTFPAVAPLLVIRSTVLLVGILVVCAGGCSKPEPRYGPDYVLSDDDIASYALKASDPSFRKQEIGGRIIGVHKGTRVVSEFPTLDDGISTVAIIHYDVDAGEACKRAGGLVRLELVPAAMAAVEKPFCVPKVLVDRHIRATPL
jgi:hypothetical protein